jgi:aminocarboxymuconate-semialdehyde decarboxylase
MISGKVYRTVSDKCWDPAKRLIDMDEQHVGFQVLSPMPELLSYWMPTDAAVQLQQFLNDAIGAMVDASAGRLLGLGAVALQDVDVAIRQLRSIMSTPGFSGVEIGSNVNGVPIGAEQFNPFFEAAEDLGAAVFVHALKPTGRDRLIGPPQLLQALAYPTDVGLAAASVICTNLIVRRPRLRLAFSHGGGTLSALLPRLQQATTVFEKLKDQIIVPPIEQARKFYYDGLVFDEATLSHLVDQFGDTQIMLGSDYPFAFRDTKPTARIASTRLSAISKDRLIHQNARTFLGLPVKETA